MLELRLMTEPDIDAASGIIVKAHDIWHDIGVGNKGFETALGLLKEKRMRPALKIGGVYVLGFRENMLVSVYNLPRFKRSVGIESESYGYFASEPERQGIGHEFLYGLSNVFEEHQKTKKDTSGTAKLMLKFFNRLGLEYAEKDITKIRRSNRLHSFHTYTLTSEKGDVLLEFRHDIKSHGVYAQGTLDAIRFLRNRLLVTGNRYSTKERYQGQTYSMIDVMKGLMHMHYSRSILKV